MRLFVLSMLSTCLLLACSKDNEPTKPTASAVTISGVANVNVPRGRNSALLLSVAGAGTEQFTSLSINGLPSGVTAAFSPSEGTTPFSSTITFSAAPTATIGNTTMGTITSMTPDGQAREYRHSVTIVAPTDCAQDLIGTYSASDLCTPGGSVAYATTISADPSQPNRRIIISNFAHTGSSVYADLNCGYESVTIPTQTIGSYIVSGAGGYTSTTLFFDYEIHVMGGGIATCVTHMSR